jgi:hypothetical protein
VNNKLFPSYCTNLYRCEFWMLGQQNDLGFTPITQSFARYRLDILDAVDEGNVTILASFDLSAAFDTVDHAILIRGL